jgi:hypothetical protein
LIATAALDVVRFWSVGSGRKIGEWTKSGGVSTGSLAGGGGRVSGSNVCCMAMKPSAPMAGAASDSVSIIFAAGDVGSMDDSD